VTSGLGFGMKLVARVATPMARLPTGSAAAGTLTAASPADTGAFSAGTELWTRRDNCGRPQGLPRYNLNRTPSGPWIRIVEP
jgi:hypothetical protein